MQILIFLITLFSTAFSAVLNTATKYDPVWLASVENFPMVRTTNFTKDFWSLIYDVHVEFRLFTRKNPDKYQVLETDNPAMLYDSFFNKDLPIKVLTHGWYNNGSSPMPVNIKEAYLNVSDLNIIVVDWASAANVNYVSASYNVASVGRHLTWFLNFLITEGVSMYDVHLIGHSLGAHVVGIAGAFVEKGPIHSITGLDPALPLFTEGNKDARLDKHDAQYVEVIHTCGGYLGFAKPIGHVDFYPNGGSSQPGCGTDYRGFCAHNRAHRFFAESIFLDVDFVASRCESYDNIASGCCKPTGETLNMGGFDINDGKEGVYYLSTNSESPYAKGSKRKDPFKF